ncbi:MAG: glycosyltransferase family 2 protein [Bacteroidia bacterium]
MKTETSRKNILVIIPCYNEEQSIGRLLLAIDALKLEHASVVPLVVNDCSTDSSLSEIQKKNARHLDLPVNLGIGGAVQSGLMYAQRGNFDIAVQMDGDGQHPPGELAKLIAPLLEDQADVCIGSRFITHEGFQSTAARRAGINFLSGLIRLCSGRKIHDCTSGYRAFNRKAIDLCVAYYPDKYPEPESILYLLKNNARVLEVPVTMAARDGGVSSIRSLNSIYYMIKVSLAIIFLHLKPSLHE